jgi:hypothetical protein
LVHVAHEGHPFKKGVTTFERKGVTNFKEGGLPLGR